MKKLTTILLLLLGGLLLLSASEGIIFEEDYIKQAIAHHDKGEFKEALALYNRVLRQNPGNETAIYEKAYTLSTMKKYFPALRVSRKLLHSADQKIAVLTYIMHGNILDEMGRRAKSIKLYKQGLKLAPGHYLLHYNLAVTLARQGNYPESRVNLLKALEGNPFHLNSLYTLALIDDELANSLSLYLASTFYLLYDGGGGERAENIREILKMLYTPGRNDKEEKIVLNSEMNTVEMAVKLAISGHNLELFEKGELSERESYLKLSDNILALTVESEDELPQKELSPWQLDSLKILSYIKESGHMELLTAKVIDDDYDKEGMTPIIDIIRAYYR